MLNLYASPDSWQVNDRGSSTKGRVQTAGIVVGNLGQAAPLAEQGSNLVRGAFGADRGDQVGVIPVSAAQRSIARPEALLAPVTTILMGSTNWIVECGNARYRSSA